MKADGFSDLIKAIHQLDHYQRKTLSIALAEFSDTSQAFELIESHFDSVGVCPHCGHSKLYRHGSALGLQRYRCRTCHRTFNALTGTPLARLRHRSKWLDYLETMIHSLPLRQSAVEVGVHRNTALRWRHRFLSWLKRDRPDALQGITEADETYLLESDKGHRQLTRRPHKRGASASKRGLSKQQVCVLVARDRAGQTLVEVTGKGAMSKAQLTEHSKPVLNTDAVLISDSNPTYSAFCKTEHITHVAVNLSKGQRIINGAYHIQNVNAYHSRLKSWLHRFHGVATKYLPNYLGWRQALEQHRNLLPGAFLRAALGDFQQLTVT